MKINLKDKNFFYLVYCRFRQLLCIAKNDNLVKIVENSKFLIIAKNDNLVKLAENGKFLIIAENDIRQSTGLFIKNVDYKCQNKNMCLWKKEFGLLRD